MTAWCECKSTPGYVTLIDPKNIFVCVTCLKPSWMVYDKWKKECIECSGTFSNPWELVCAPCRDELLLLSNECEGEERTFLLENVSSKFYQSWEYYRNRELGSTTTRD